MKKKGSLKRRENEMTTKEIGQEAEIVKDQQVETEGTEMTTGDEKIDLEAETEAENINTGIEEKKGIMIDLEVDQAQATKKKRDNSPQKDRKIGDKYDK